VFGTTDEVVSADHIHLASTGDTVLVGGGGDGGGNGEIRIMYLYFMALHSERQPDVTYFVCGGAMVQPSLAAYPSVQEIRNAIGDYATLILPGDDS
jgi:hypothetical protein